ncbi:glycoside hydrolase family 88 protein [Neiella sp. HB171785]|uniref:Glycoside hydrolase family 88 protein n=1 Tax=Neiella litorisoli TaxID=2771431 RepID=A0A8J6QMX4_9GAMM|nr:glycoside hydrolase family 88 protein [Neiella litorisoli]MBD1391452.1 glycoside hydrolase family 88 protein [Neiella litorisoli]
MITKVINSKTTSRKFIVSSLSLALAVAIGGCANTSSPAATTVESSYQQARLVQLSAHDIGHRASEWQINHLDNLDYLAERYWNSSSKPTGWIQAAFYIGLTRWVETTEDKAMLEHIEQMAKAQNYGLRVDRFKHADDHAIGQTYLWLTEQTGNTDAYGPTQALFDKILASPSDVSLEMDEDAEPKRYAFESPCQDRWCWSDALFMAPRTWLKLSNVTQDPKYFEFADKEFWDTVDYLFSEKYGLFFRDSRYFEMKSDNGKPVFWSRGNGWVFAALPLIIDDLPADHPSRDKYIELYKKNADGLQRIQNSNGYWSASLLDPNKVKTPEVSGTGFITFGLAWGVNNGILTEAKYKTAVEKGWQAIEQAVEPSGKVNWVQQVGKSPDPVQQHETQFYGVGAVLLAAAEMTKWQG